MRERAAVHVFQFATQRHTMGQAAGSDAVLAGQLRQVMRGGLAFHGGIGGDDQFADFALLQTLAQLVRPSSRGPIPSSGDNRPCRMK